MAVELDIAQLHRLSLEEYHRLIESGGFDEDAHVELIDGLLAEMSPKSPEHENAIAWLAVWLIDAVDRGAFEVRVASPLTLEGSEPEPDLAVIPRDAPRPYHPATASLVIEVSASSLRRDLGVKAALYARAGVTEYWVLDLAHRRLVVHRNPSVTAGTYAELLELQATDRVNASAVALPELAISDVLAAADA
jgi:Uma2 family endonuclease